MAFAWDALAFVHARLGEHREAISCYQKALALVRERKNPTARGLLVRLLAESGDARRAAAREACSSLQSSELDGPTCGLRQARAVMVRLSSRRSAAGAADSPPSHRGRRHSVCGTPIARQPGGFR